MNVQVGKFLHPGEIHRMVIEEKYRRRKTRLNQVRDLSRENSMQIVSAVNSKRQQHLRCLSDELEEEWEDQRTKYLKEYQQQYSDCLEKIGQSHREAKQEIAARESFKEKLDYNWEQARIRGKQALAKLAEERNTIHQNLLLEKDIQKLVANSKKAGRKKFPLATSKCEGHHLSVNSSSHLQEPDMIVASYAPLEMPHGAQDMTDAYQTALLERERQQTENAYKEIRKQEQSSLEKKRFQKAHNRMKLEQEYLQFMNAMEKIADMDDMCESDWSSLLNKTKKKEQIAEQEAIIEAIFSKLSITLEEKETPNTTGDKNGESREDTPVYHIVVSSTSNSELEGITENQIKSLSKATANSTSDTNEHNSSKVSSGSNGGNKRFNCSTNKSLINTEETILATHPTEAISTITIDLTSLPYTDESSTPFPDSSTSVLTMDVKNYSSEQVSTSVTNNKSTATTLKSPLPFQQLEHHEQSGLREQLESHGSRILTKSPTGVCDINTVDQRVLIFQNVTVSRNSAQLVVGNKMMTHATDIRDPKNDTNEILKSQGVYVLDKSSLLNAAISIPSSKSSEDDVTDELHLFQKDLPCLQRSTKKLSTIQEVDSPTSSYHRMQDYFLQCHGITDEPDLTLVESRSSHQSTPTNLTNQLLSAYVTSSEPSKMSIRLNDAFQPQLDNQLHGMTESTSTHPARRFIDDSRVLHGVTSSSSCTNENFDSILHVKTPTMSSNSTTSWDTCFTSRLRDKLTEISDFNSLPPSSISYNSNKRLSKSVCLSEFFDTSNLSSMLNLNSVNSLLESTRPTPKNTTSSSRFCPSMNHDQMSDDDAKSSVLSWQSTSSATFDDSINSSLLSFLQHEHSADSSSNIILNS